MTMSLATLLREYAELQATTAESCRKLADLANTLFLLRGDQNYHSDSVYFAELAGRIEPDPCTGLGSDEGKSGCGNRATYTLASGAGLCEHCYHAGDDRDRDGITALEGPLP